MLFLYMTETFVDDLFEGLAPYLLENMIILKQWEQFSSQKNVSPFRGVTSSLVQTAKTKSFLKMNIFKH